MKKSDEMVKPLYARLQFADERGHKSVRSPFIDGRNDGFSG